MSPSTRKYLILMLLHMTSGQVPPSPCPEVYGYGHDGYGLYGIITAKNPPPIGSTMTVVVKISLAVYLEPNQKATLSFYHDTPDVIRSIQLGSPIYYKLRFPVASPIPNIVNINFSGRVICNGPPAYGSYVTNQDISYTSRTTLPSGDYYPNYPVAYKPGDYYTQPQVVTTQRVYTPAPVNIPVTESVKSQTTNTPLTTTAVSTPKTNLDRLEAICGTTLNVIQLIVNGVDSNKGDWPWLVAIFYKMVKNHGEIKKEFKCGGSLISDNMVVTAAHCVTINTVPIKVETLVLKLGTHDIDDDTEEESLLRGVREIRIRDDYTDSYKHDIAVLMLKSKVAFTNHIRPVCLWKGPADQKLVFGKEGKVVGWGRDANNPSVTPTPHEVQVPIVSTDECKGSSPFLAELISDDTLCGGAKDSSGPCSGDSGGGLYLKINGRWTIRGLVSESLKAQDENFCDLYQYVVYTDVAKYIGWINS